MNSKIGIFPQMLLFFKGNSVRISQSLLNDVPVERSSLNGKLTGSVKETFIVPKELKTSSKS